MRRGRRQHGEGAAEISFDHPIPACSFGLEDERIAQNRSSVDYDIDAAEARQRQIHSSLGCPRRSDVPSVGSTAQFLGQGFRYCRVGFITADGDTGVGDYNARPQASEFLRDRTADAAAAARHKSNTACEIKIAAHATAFLLPVSAAGAW